MSEGHLGATAFLGTSRGEGANPTRTWKERENAPPTPTPGLGRMKEPREWGELVTRRLQPSWEWQARSEGAGEGEH